MNITGDQIVQIVETICLTTVGVSAWYLMIKEYRR